MMFGKYIISQDELIINHSYNDSLSKIKIPDNIRTVIFGQCFNQEIENHDIPNFL